MKPTSHSNAPKDRLTEFISGISPAEEGTNGNDAGPEKSRWIKWTFIKKGDENKLFYKQADKSESTRFSRFLDRINPFAAAARKAARQEIKKILHESGLNVTADIRKHLPNSYKLGNAYGLRDAIHAGMEAIDQYNEDRALKLSDHFKEDLENKILENQDSPTSPLSDHASNSYTLARDWLTPESKPAFKKFCIDFAGKLSKKNTNLNQKDIESMFKGELHSFCESLINNDEWKKVKDICETTIDLTLEKLQLDGQINDDQKDSLSQAMEKSLNEQMLKIVLHQLAGEVLFYERDNYLSAINGRLGPGVDDDMAVDIFNNIFSAVQKVETGNQKQ